ncbi:ABC transporter substrate-binding protein [Bradyrhizobium sp. BR 10289]|uniref:ABC transporter substrate-binding protein n=1 Tax=Bradyrhizobium sp. BR 10289 TaxID=2749993 RepID=UPI001C64DFE1|nr:ABC transporter substrate-binding protein [Bradyrhizobium sp. BR 10289]MBW7972517.1 ABC transporter substrate-binding protein [Bradyrhizobium sp. BR 10289]
MTGLGAQAQDAKPLRIGVLTDMSSLYADVTGAGSLLAAKMAVEDFQASPHRMTRPIEVISGDHMNKADVGANIAREWIDRQSVDVIVDAPNSAVALAVRNIVQQNNKTLLVSGASSSDLTGKSCSPNLVHWTYDTYALSSGVARAVVESGGKSWFLLTADYAFGHAMEGDIKNVVQKFGGKVLGGVRTPINTQDFSSFLLQAQSSKAEIIALVNAGGDTINSIKQAVEFGIPQGGQRVVATVLYLSDVHSLGLKIAQGLQFTEAFYWDLNDDTRAWTKRFAPRNNGRYPTALHAGAYSTTLHYLKAVDALGASSDGKAVVEQMKKLPTDDPLFGKGSVRADGRKLHNMYLFEVKTPADSKYPWDYYKTIKTIPPAEAWRPVEEGGCEFLKS